MKAVVALGSNLGDSQATLDLAIEEIMNFCELKKVSSFVETDPVGGPKQPNYLNAVLIAESELSADEFLKNLQIIELKLGRTREVHWGPRTVDLDLIIYGQTMMNSKDLTLPHPLAHERKFVLEPWLEIDPDGEIPGKGFIKEILASLN
jgi:2-amino-4-hydroxy-6-hydroxymethyldihydropteridine diphosphokinase